MRGALPSAEAVLFLMGRVAWEKTQTSYARSLPLFKDWDTLKEHKKIISKGKVVTMNSILGYYPYTLFQTLLLSTQDGST